MLQQLSGMSIYEEKTDMRGKEHWEVEEDKTSCIVVTTVEWSNKTTH